VRFTSDDFLQFIVTGFEYRRLRAIARFINNLASFGQTFTTPEGFLEFTGVFMRFFEEHITVENDVPGTQGKEQQQQHDELDHYAGVPEHGEKTQIIHVNVTSKEWRK
jgi:hypothetical protein